MRSFCGWRRGVIDDDDDDDDESSSEEEDDDEDDDDVTFSPSVHDDELNASTRAAADEMLRAGDVSHEVASLFAARVPRGVATSWEDARRGSTSTRCVSSASAAARASTARARPRARSNPRAIDPSVSSVSTTAIGSKADRKPLGARDPKGRRRLGGSPTTRRASRRRWRRRRRFARGSRGPERLERSPTCPSSRICSKSYQASTRRMRGF